LAAWRLGARLRFLILFLGGLAAWREANKNTGNYMRGKLRVGETIVREIRPMDVIRTCDRLLFDFKDGDSITDDQWSKALFADSDLIEGELNDDVNSAFSFINHDYLKNDVPTMADSPKKGLSMRRLKTLRAMLMKECAVLATYNHVNCWLYGWSFFSAVRALYQDK
jgi:hypothetical protein